jgi:hypothetical protein
MNYTLLVTAIGWYLIGMFIGAIGEQVWLGSGDVDITNAILGFKVDQVSSGGGFFGMMRIGIAFLTQAIPRLATFDYQFLSGDWVVVRFLLATLFGGPLVFLGAREFISAIQGIWRR